MFTNMNNQGKNSSVSKTGLSRRGMILGAVAGGVACLFPWTRKGSGQVAGKVLTVAEEKWPALYFAGETGLKVEKNQYWITLRWEDEKWILRHMSQIKKGDHVVLVNPDATTDDCNVWFAYTTDRDAFKNHAGVWTNATESRDYVYFNYPIETDFFTKTATTVIQAYPLNVSACGTVKALSTDQNAHEWAVRRYRYNKKTKSHLIVKEYRPMIPAKEVFRKYSL